MDSAGNFYFFFPRKGKPWRVWVYDPLVKKFKQRDITSDTINTEKGLVHPIALKTSLNKMFLQKQPSNEMFLQEQPFNKIPLVNRKLYSAYSRL